MGAIRSERELVLDQGDREVPAVTAASYVRVRAARLSDAPDLLVLCRQLGYSPSLEEIGQAVDDLDGVGHTVLVATVAESVVGWIELQSYRLLSSGREALIAGLVVDEAHRGQGLGRHLMAAAEDWARARGVSAIRVRSRDTRERAHGFYRDLGFEEVKRQVVFRKKLE